jgi:hypothetical protein
MKLQQLFTGIALPLTFFGILLQATIFNEVYAKPRVKPTTIRRTGWDGRPIDDTTYYGLKVSWTFSPVQKTNNNGQTSLPPITFDSLELAMMDSRVSPEDKAAIQREYLPKFAQLQNEITQLNKTVKSDQKTPPTQLETKYRPRLEQILEKYRALSPSTIEPIKN